MGDYNLYFKNNGAQLDKLSVMCDTSIWRIW